MPSILLIVFFIQLAIHLINTIGAKTFNDLLWQLSTSLSLPGSSSSGQVQEVVRLRREVGRLKREMNATSAQDDFAKWAKLRREHDKVLADHDKKAAAMNESRSSFDTKASAVRWLATSGLRFGLQFWHAKRPMFALPKGWFPWYVEWVLGFPRCPYGGVSINVWATACGVVIALAADVVDWLVASRIQSNEKVKVQMPAGSAAGQGKEKKTS